MKCGLQEVALVMAALFLTACSSSPMPEPFSRTEVPDPDSATASSLQYYPPDTVTGIEEIDVVLRAVASEDPQQVRDLFGYTSTTCIAVNALGGPAPCREGEAEGTPVEVLPSLGPEGSFLRKDEAGKFLGLNAVGVYAVYQVSDRAYSEMDYPAGKYAIMLIGEAGGFGHILQIREGMIVRIDYIFEYTAFSDFLQRDASRLILPPRP